ncbi:DUF3102 domain-containing protein [Rhizobium sp. TRM95111]|uniref:DUF3102 domain-containing protein n=1 Tax=Rhizobium alarense TaxID=2846851 RepID=UPI001F20318E|nr:DUF3102 domain-containing protein [Rhizobium alarense]MCF3638735.1 DUF3102 domain-containing protein [Rhizobium alarense]
MTEIEVEGIGTIRQLNDWQYVRLRRIRGPNREIASFAFASGMSLHQFKALPVEKQRACREAYMRITAPDFGAPRQRPQQPVPPRPWARLSQEKQAELGRKLLEVKAQLPRGHFRPWIEQKSGISYTQAQRFMRAAKV